MLITPSQRRRATDAECRNKEPTLLYKYKWPQERKLSKFWGETQKKTIKQTN